MKNLKNKISEVLISELQTKTLDKITVSTITDKLGVSRQAFYYHFFDIYEVIEWVFKDAAEKILNEHGTLDSWQVGFYTVMNWIKDNKSFVINSFKSVNRDYIETFMYNVLFPYINKAVEETSKNRNIHKNQKAFIAKYFTLSFISIIINWIKHDMIEEPKIIVNNLEILIEGDFQKAISNFEKKNAKQ